MDDVFTPAEVADILKIPISTLYSWRWRGLGPKAIKVGRHLRYQQRELEKYLGDLEEHEATAGRR
jgi:predicted site-specific integrase-resolvase